MLVLRGRVPSYYYKQVAQEAVKGIEGVDQVINDTEVVASVS
jgi:osmotically-inducible protein OsmY